ncbi:hypothetical protein DI396_08115 [Litorivita pollutaquae]|uniref:Uncharacterized protein n=1 Tax=Litorivita pollutaquae TaxID=2200892 RepID=A0A2V4MMT7_9RHOB|nr:hypothetical protein [Litorivita pollutaquae]OUS22321.1 hypothetical protein A9Q95_04835 [Rhodobacterales bacterium 59_46_T64]PYC48031.1 hypothetical protein DI396_08115 [Litorivita pollutaquae]
MADSFADFDTRLRKIDRTQRKMQGGYTTHVGRDGLIVVRPRRSGVRLPLKGMMILALGFFGFKGALLAHLGPQTYADKVAVLELGSPVEQFGAWAMVSDPATQVIARTLSPYLR